MAAAALPSSARVVIVGGGVIGSSIAYHFGKLGWGKDVVLLERDKITSGTTWHAAGLMVCFGSTSETSTEMRKYSKALYQRLEAETGQPTGFKPVGFIEIASDPDRLEEYRRVSAFNRLCGVDVEEIGPKDVERLFPLCRTDDVLRGFYVKDDGRVNPVDVTMAMAKGARMSGVRMFENTPVENVEKRNGRVHAVRTESGHVIEAEYVVNCCGMWARQFAAKAGVCVPLQAAEHYYLLTERIPEVSPNWPVIEDPGFYGYYREEGGGLMVGLFEPVCAPWNVKGIPKDASFTTITPDWERLTPFLEKAMSRVPASTKVGVRQLFCGPESFTPDLKPIVGFAPELKNYFVCAGLNSIGILTGGGMGRVVANWIATGKPDVDVTGMNIDRTQTYQTNPKYLAERTVESLGLVYQCHYPTWSMASARNVRKSPIHERLMGQRAYFKEVSGWEGADWYAPVGVVPKVDKYCWGRHNWFPYWVEEHNAIRNGVALVDMSFMCKFRVQGEGAGHALNYLSANNVDQASHRITYTQWLNPEGKLEADLTVTKLGHDDFFVVATDTALRHVQAHFYKYLPDQYKHLRMVDVSSGVAQINVQGPRSRELMQKLTQTDMSNAAFPFRHATEIDIGFARVLCIRITYLGELGYELYVPSEQATHVYDRLVAEGESVGLKHAGLKALASCRMEKAYRDYGHDLDNTDNVLDAGLGFCVSMKKPCDFVGKAAVDAHKKSGKAFNKRIVQVLCKDPKPMMFHAEPIVHNGKAIGYMRAASYGHTLGGAVGLGMVEAPEGKIVDDAFLQSGKWEVQIANDKFPAVCSIRPLYDPDNKRILA